MWIGVTPVNVGCWAFIDEVGLWLLCVISRLRASAKAGRAPMSDALRIRRALGGNASRSKRMSPTRRRSRQWLNPHDGVGAVSTCSTTMSAISIAGGDAPLDPSPRAARPGYNPLPLGPLPRSRGDELSLLRVIPWGPGERPSPRREIGRMRWWLVPSGEAHLLGFMRRGHDCYKRRGRVPKCVRTRTTRAPDRPLEGAQPFDCSPSTRCGVVAPPHVDLVEGRDGHVHRPQVRERKHRRLQPAPSLRGRRSR